MEAPERGLPRKAPLSKMLRHSFLFFFLILTLENNNSVFCTLTLVIHLQGKKRPINVLSIVFSCKLHRKNIY